MMELTLQLGDLRRRELGGEPADGILVAVDQRRLGFLLTSNSFIRFDSMQHRNQISSNSNSFKDE